MVSVVIATFNGEKFIEEQLESICHQTYLPSEVIIVDDCSLDNTYRIIEDFAENHNELRWKILKNKKNMGYVKTFLNAIDFSQGEIIILCDQDDLWSDKKISNIVKAFQENDDMLSLHENYSIIDIDGHLIKQNVLNYQKPLEKYSLYKFCKRLNYCGMSSSFHASLKPYLKLMEEHVLPTHDWIIHAISVCKHGMYISNNVSSFRRFHGNNTALKLDKITRKGIEQRKSIVNEYLDYYLLLKIVYSKFGNHVTNDEHVINHYIKTCKIRLKYLNNKNLLLYLKSFRKIKYFQSIKSFICDYIYLIGIY